MKGHPSEEALAFLRSHPEAWLEILLNLHVEVSAEIAKVASQGSENQKLFEGLGPEGRKLQALTTEKTQEAYSFLARQRLRLEMAVEELGWHKNSTLVLTLNNEMLTHPVWSGVRR